MKKLTKSKRIETLLNLGAIFVCVIILALTIVRLFFGVELSDEAYSVAETYMVANGALPFVNNWSQMPGWTLLIAPFVKLYVLIAGGTDGIFLFFRFLSLAINAETAFVVSFLLKDHVRNRFYLLLLSFVYVGASGVDYAVPFRGDNLAIDLFAVGTVMLAVCFADHKEKISWMFISGILLALAVLSHPILAVVFGYFMIVIAILNLKKKRKFKEGIYFLLGATLAALIVVSYLIINSSVSDLFSGIQYLLHDVMYFQLENSGIAKWPGYVKQVISESYRLFSFSIVSMIMFSIILVIFARKYILKIDTEYVLGFRKDFVKRLFLLSFLVGICLYHAYQLYIFGTAGNTGISLNNVMVEALAALLMFALIMGERKRLCTYLMIFVWIPSFIWVLLVGAGTYSGIWGRNFLLKNAAYLFGLFMLFLIEECFDDEKEMVQIKNGAFPKWHIFEIFLKNALPVAVMAVILFSYLLNAYTYVYRDDHIGALRTVVSDGPYKGIRTTKVRADGIIELDRIIDEYVDEDDYVLAMDNDPFIYLLSNGRVCSPSSWDEALYSYGFDQPNLYYDYFHITKTEPTKIIYFNYGRDEIMSIDTEYRFNEYVHDNYHLVYEDRNIFEWNYCGKDNTCEILIFERN